MLTAEDLLSEDIVEEYDDNPGEVEDQEHDNDGEAEEAGENDGETEKKTVKPKRIVRNPQPKLNEETLNGPRGISALESYFERVKFKGSGHEEQDLAIILKTYEYWCHRLFPKYAFDECISKIERLGSKKAVQTHIKRIRLDMLQEDKPLVSDDDEDDTKDENDAVFGSIDNHQFEPEPAVETVPEITEEQLERIKLNRERAERLKMERLRKLENETQQNSASTDNNSSPSQLNGIDLSGTVLDTEASVLDTEASVLDTEAPVLDTEVQESQTLSEDNRDGEDGMEFENN